MYLYFTFSVAGKRYIKAKWKDEQNRWESFQIDTVKSLITVDVQARS